MKYFLWIPGQARNDKLYKTYVVMNNKNLVIEMLVFGVWLLSFYSCFLHRREILFLQSLLRHPVVNKIPREDLIQISSSIDIEVWVDTCLPAALSPFFMRRI